MRPVSASPVTVPVARAADCAILCVSLGTSSLTAVTDTIEQIGRKCFLGSLLVRGQQPSAALKRRPSTGGSEGARS
jgi:hypothetical protein